MRGLGARLLLIGALLAPFALPHGANAALFGDDDKLNALRAQVDANQKALEERLSKLEASAADRGAILDLAGQLDQLRSDLANLRGQVEVLTNQIQTAEKRQKDLYLDIDTRLRKLEQAREQAAAAGTPPATGEAPATPAETKAYEAALNQFKLGNYPLAISAFEGFLVTYPSSSLAPSAQYWIGNAYYAQRDYRKAISSQQKLLAAWPDSSKVPDAMLNIASSQDAGGDRSGARKTLEDLLAKYPASPAAASAKQRLQGLRR
ncbi:MAG TPA: tol-pal system protein YbgF [Burkholderiales bacterium]|nr:tol-pal system protein YbgF [Burkholderiales bacterium]